MKTKTPKHLRLINAGVRNLKEFGYPAVTAQNITSDYVFRAFFKSMLEDNLGKGADAEINDLLAEIAENSKPPAEAKNETQA